MADIDLKSQNDRLNEHLRLERDNHRAKDRVYTAKLKEQAEAHAKHQKHKDDQHAKDRDKHIQELKRLNERHAAEIKRLKDEQDKALAAALAETPEARKHRLELAAIKREANDRARKAVAEFRGVGAGV